MFALLQESENSLFGSATDTPGTVQPRGSSSPACVFFRRQDFLLQISHRTSKFYSMKYQNLNTVLPPAVMVKLMSFVDKQTSTAGAHIQIHESNSWFAGPVETPNCDRVTHVALSMQIVTQTFTPRGMFAFKLVFPKAQTAQTRHKTPCLWPPRAAFH